MKDIAYEFDEAKSKKLRRERGLGFEEMIALMEAGCVVKSYPHPNHVKHPAQQVHAVNVEGYAWLVITEKHKEKNRLITLYQCRKATRKWLKENDNGTEKN